jgi:hypothetical protein
MADEEVSENGKFLDTKEGKIVDSQPEEGVQLIAPGVVVTPEHKSTVERYETGLADQGDVERAADVSQSPEVREAREKTVDPKTVTTRDGVPSTSRKGS